MTQAGVLGNEQIADYRENGFLVVRNVLPPSETNSLRRIVENQAECNAYAPSLEYPAPGKYTVSGNTISAHPDWRRLPNTPQLLTALKVC